MRDILDVYGEAARLGQAWLAAAEMSGKAGLTDYEFATFESAHDKTPARTVTFE